MLTQFIRQLEFSITLTLRRAERQEARIPSLVPPASPRVLTTTATPITLRPLAKTSGNVVQLSTRRRRSA